MAIASRAHLFVVLLLPLRGGSLVARVWPRAEHRALLRPVRTPDITVAAHAGGVARLERNSRKNRKQEFGGLPLPGRW